MAGFCDCGNEPSASINLRKFLYQFTNYDLLSDDSDPWSSTGLRRLLTALFQISFMFSFRGLIAEVYCSLLRVAVQTTQFAFRERSFVYPYAHLCTILCISVIVILVSGTNKPTTCCEINPYPANVENMVSS